MFEQLEAGAGLDVVLWLQTMENPFLTTLAELFAFLGGDYAYLVALPLIYWSVNRRLGRWLLVVLVLGLFILIGSKELLERPRPYTVGAQALISISSGYGFPSGHVGLSTAIWGFIVLWVQRRWAYAVLVVYVLFMAWSRMYGGMHFPQDVIGGFTLGALTSIGLYTTRDQLQAAWARVPDWLEAVLIVVSSVLIAVFLLADEAGLSAAGILIGGGLGLMLEYRIVRFSADGGVWRRGLRFGVGVLITAAVFILLDIAFEGLSPEPLFRVVRYGLVAFVILGLYPVLMVKIGLAKTETPSSPS